MPHRPVFALGLLAACVPGIGAITSGRQATEEAPEILVFPGANSRPTYFSIHNVREAWETSRGAGVKVGILDHSFGFRTHPGLYAGGQSFQTDDWARSFDTVSHHGYWMASTLRELVPDVEIYALGTYSGDESAKVDAMVHAIDWAIANHLDVLTYSAERFSAAVRPKLDSAVDRALAAGIVTTFIHYPHPGNLLPTWLGPRTGDDEREPDLNILQYDYQVVFTRRYGDWTRRGRESGYVPFLSISSTSPVTAAFVAMLKSVRPDLGPADVKRVLRETARPMTFEGSRAERAVDTAAALRSVRR
jgi:hypothetical protein